MLATEQLHLRVDSWPPPLHVTRAQQATCTFTVQLHCQYALLNHLRSNDALPLMYHYQCVTDVLPQVPLSC
jgi:hypothetical protein